MQSRIYSTYFFIVISSNEKIKMCRWKIFILWKGVIQFVLLLNLALETLVVFYFLSCESEKR